MLKILFNLYINNIATITIDGLSVPGEKRGPFAI